MKAEIVTIGDEILIGQIVDTNSAWIAQQLSDLGIAIERINSVADTREAILGALSETQERADLVLMTGGLGPTKDDITKQTLCEYFGVEMRQDEQILEDVKYHFVSRGYSMPEVNNTQAEVPANCTAIRNAYGTAPGMWFEYEGTVFISMPGVPYEMKGLMQDDLLERISAHFKTPTIVHRTVLTQGIGESWIMEQISDWEAALANDNIKLAYLPSPGSVRMRLSTTGENKEQLEAKVNEKANELMAMFPQYAYGFGTDTLESVVGQLLNERNQTISTAESCTGGYLAHLLTSVSGSSNYFYGSVISYSNQLKRDALGVESMAIDNHGAVSQQVVEQMARGIRSRYNTDYSIATSGIAGPSGGTEEKPVGTVWIGIAGPKRLISKKFQFGDDRGRNIRKTAITALNLLRREIVEIGI